MNWVYRVKPPRNILRAPSSTAEIFEPAEAPGAMKIGTSRAAEPIRVPIRQSSPKRRRGS